MVYCRGLVANVNRGSVDLLRRRVSEALRTDCHRQVSNSRRLIGRRGGEPSLRLYDDQKLSRVLFGPVLELIA